MRLGVGSIRPESVSVLEQEPPCPGPSLPTDSAGTAALMSTIEVNALTSGPLYSLLWCSGFSLRSRDSRAWAQ